MEGQTLLLTGSTGHVGFNVLQHALRHGYHVRAVVRSQGKADKVRSSAAIKALASDGQLSFVVIPEFFRAGALDEAMKGVQYVIHCASPLPFSMEATTDNAEEDFIRPAVDGTLNTLRSAAQEKSVKRVVITSSIIAVTPVAAVAQDLGLTYTAETRQPDPEGSFGAGTPNFLAYAASKVSALNQAEAWVKKTQPHFDVIHIMPTFVLGSNDLWTSVAEMKTSPNSFVLSIIAGEGGVLPKAMAINHVDDCGRIHVEALAPSVEGHSSIIINTTAQWDDAKAVVEKRFPEAVKDGRLANKGQLDSVTMSIDAAKTAKTFGIKHSYEDAVVSAAEQYLELLEKTEPANGVNGHS